MSMTIYPRMQFKSHTRLIDTFRSTDHFFEDWRHATQVHGNRYDLCVCTTEG
jgi:hypothetical protein